MAVYSKVCALISFALLSVVPAGSLFNEFPRLSPIAAELTEHRMRLPDTQAANQT